MSCMMMKLCINLHNIMKCIMEDSQLQYLTYFTLLKVLTLLIKLTLVPFIYLQVLQVLLE